MVVTADNGYPHQYQFIFNPKMEEDAVHVIYVSLHTRIHTHTHVHTCSRTRMLCCRASFLAAGISCTGVESCCRIFTLNGLWVLCPIIWRCSILKFSYNKLSSRPISVPKPLSFPLLSSFSFFLTLLIFSHNLISFRQQRILLTLVSPPFYY